MNCKVCGNELNQEDSFCNYCEYKLKQTASTLNYFTNSRVSEHELSLFVGKHAEVYLEKWREGSRWNWSAFFFDAYWLLYRKMYLYCLLFLIISSLTISSTVSLFIRDAGTAWFGLLVGFILYGIVKIALGFFANRLYFHHANRKISHITLIPYEPAPRERQIAKAGGTSISILIALIVLPIVSVIIIGLSYFIKTYKEIDNALDSMSTVSESIEESMVNESNDDDLITSTEQFGLQQPSNVWDGTEPIHVLLLGGDSDESNVLPHSDSMLVVTINPATKKLYLFTVLRDTYASIPDYGMDEINKAITIGGPGLAMRTVEELLGIPIEYYVYTDYKGFKAVIDEVGGIWFEVEKDMRYTDNASSNRYDIDLEQGYQLLNGDKALQYVRFRHDAFSDYARTERQRNLLIAIANKITAETSLSNFSDVLTAVEPYVETNLSPKEMLNFFQLAYESSSGDIVSLQLPPFELLHEEMVNSVSVLSVEPDQLIEYVQSVLKEATY